MIGGLVGWLAVSRWALAAEEPELLPEGSAIVEMLRDDAVMREQARGCWSD